MSKDCVTQIFKLVLLNCERVVFILGAKMQNNFNFFFYVLFHHNHIFRFCTPSPCTLKSHIPTSNFPLKIDLWTIELWNVLKKCIISLHLLLAPAKCSSLKIVLAKKSNETSSTTHVSSLLMSLTLKSRSTWHFHILTNYPLDRKIALITT